MTQYIDKDALVAEIINLKVKYECGWNCAIDKILDYIDDLEVKEVDLEKIFNDEYSKFSNDPDAMDYAFPIDLSDYKDFAKHFFELGLNHIKSNKNE